MSTRTLIRGGCVLTLGAKTPNHPAADVLIENGEIADVGEGLRARDAEVIDASDAIVMPGFVDTHRHTWRSLFRNLGDLGDAGSLGVHYRPDDVYAATLIGLLGALEAGVTTVVDWFDLPLDPALVDAALQAHADAGVRGVFVPSAASAQDTAATLQRLMAAGTETGLAWGSAEPTPSSLDGVAAEWAEARRLGVRIHALAGTDAAHQGAIASLAGRGVLDDDVTLVHGTKLDEADLDAISSSGASVALTPSSEMAGDFGRPPVQQFIDRGIRPGLGIGDEQAAPGDVLAQMRATISLQHATYFDLKLAGKAGLPNLLTTREVIRYGTIDGANAIGMGTVTGSLEPGKQADVVVMRTDRPNIFPINDPIGAVVWGMDPSNLDWVFVAGRPVMREGALATDVPRARALAIDAQRRVADAAGIAVGLSAGATR